MAEIKTYKTALKVFGLERGATFSSSDPGWAKYVKSGVLVEVKPEKGVVRGRDS